PSGSAAARRAGPRPHRAAGGGDLRDQPHRPPLLRGALRARRHAGRNPDHRPPRRRGPRARGRAQGRAGLRPPEAAAMVRGVIYDLDGTLADTRADLADSVNAMLRRLGLPEREDRVVHGFIGEGAERLIRRSLGPQHEPRFAEAAPIWYEEYAKRLLAKTRLYDGITEVLRAPPDARAVLTNKPGDFARQILRGLGVESAFRAVL